MSSLQEKLAAGQFVVTGELTPPKGTDLTELLARARLLADSVDAFNVTDSHASKMSLSPMATAHILTDQGVEPILQMTTRDRNRIALQGDMLGASLLGVNNVVCMGGDPPHLGDHPEAKPVFDISTEELIRAAGNLNKGIDLMGNSLNRPTSFHIGAVVNPGADDLDKEISRLESKVAAGATFFQTQAIFEPERFAIFMDRIGHLDIAILAGIMPIKSVAMANFMNDKIPGINVPDQVINRIAEAEDTIAESSAIAAEIIRAISAVCQGIHVMAVGWEEHVPGVLQQAGIRKGTS
ncbi:MAG: methylenetetrahydrofolate reductase (NADPH) [Halieaceae bacterium]